MNVFRRLSNRGLVVLLAAVAGAAAVASALAVTAFGGGGATPPPEPLAQALHDAASAPPVDGVTARISFTNHLLGSDALGGLGGGGSPLLGASGRLWATNDGHLRLELQSDAGDAQIVTDGQKLTVYDGTSNTAYELTLPQHDSSRVLDRHAADARRDHERARLSWRLREPLRRGARLGRRPAGLHRDRDAEGQRRPARRRRDLVGCEHRRPAARRDRRPRLLVAGARPERDRHLVRLRTAVRRRPLAAGRREGRDRSHADRQRLLERARHAAGDRRSPLSRPPCRSRSSRPTRSTASRGATSGSWARAR